MLNIVKSNTPENYRFKTISDFKWCIERGGEVEFIWNNIVYGIFPKLKRDNNSYQQILITQTYTEKWCDTADEVLEYIIDGVSLRSIITHTEVTDRTV